MTSPKNASPRGILRRVSFHHNTTKPPPKPEPASAPHPKPQRQLSVGNIVSSHRDRFGVVPDVVGHACQDLPDYDEATASDRPHARMPLVKTEEGLVYLENAFREIGIRLVDHLDIRDFVSIALTSVKQNELYRLEDQGHSIGKREETKSFGIHLSDLKDYARSSVIMGGYLHDVPTVVFACVEELLRFGITQPKLFHEHADSTMFAGLIECFDQMEPAAASPNANDHRHISKLGPKYRYGEFILRPHPFASKWLRRQHVILACNTLLTFIQTLPPIIPPELRGALLECIKPSLRRDRELQEYTDWVLEEERDQETLRIQEERRRAKSVSKKTFKFKFLGNSHKDKKKVNDDYGGNKHKHYKHHCSSAPPKCPDWTADELDELEEPQIEMARVLIMHFPPANLSLLAYLFDFFLHIPYFPQNGMTLAGIAEKFGPHLCPGFGADQILLWILERWPLITKGVVGLEEDEDLVNRAKQLRELHTIDSVPTPGRLSRANSVLSLASSHRSYTNNKGQQFLDAPKLSSRLGADADEEKKYNNNDDDDDDDDDASVYSEASATQSVDYLAFSSSHPRQSRSRSYSTDKKYKGKFVESPTQLFDDGYNEK